MNSYEPVLAETDGGPMCRDCLTWCWRGNPTAPCDVDGCVCPDCERARRAAELDDRPDPALHNIVRDMEREARPEVQPDANVDVLTRERFSPRQRRRCRSCGAPIVWANTGQRAMPVDPDPVAGGNLQLARTGDDRLDVTVVRPGDGTHQSHWASCPHADSWRTRGAA